MARGYKNKELKSEDGEQYPPLEVGNHQLIPHFFPRYSITIYARSKQEALDKLDVHIKKLEDIK